MELATSSLDPSIYHRSKIQVFVPTNCRRCASEPLPFRCYLFRTRHTERCERRLPKFRRETDIPPTTPSQNRDTQTEHRKETSPQRYAGIDHVLEDSESPVCSESCKVPRQQPSAGRYHALSVVRRRFPCAFPTSAHPPVYRCGSVRRPW